MSETLSANRAAIFVADAMRNDMQITANRRASRALLLDCFLGPGEPGPNFTFPEDKFDKLLTYLSQNDMQVHQADAGATVGIYSFVKIVADMRRRLSRRQFEHVELQGAVTTDDGGVAPDGVPKFNTGMNEELARLVLSPPVSPSRTQIRYRPDDVREALQSEGGTSEAATPRAGRSEAPTLKGGLGGSERETS